MRKIVERILIRLGVMRKTYILAGNITNKEDKTFYFEDSAIGVVPGPNIKKYDSCIYEDEHGVVHLYFTNNIDEPAHYIKEPGEKDFKFKALAFKNDSPIC